MLFNFFIYFFQKAFLFSDDFFSMFKISSISLELCINHLFALFKIQIYIKTIKILYFSSNIQLYIR